jgi:hypothetical protein
MRLCFFSHFQAPTLPRLRLPGTAHFSSYDCRSRRQLLANAAITSQASRTIRLHSLPTARRVSAGPAGLLAVLSVPVVTSAPALWPIISIHHQTIANSVGLRARACARHGVLVFGAGNERIADSIKKGQHRDDRNANVFEAPKRHVG